ncbi:MAG: translational GTPase TypA, partial [Pirellulales bacterium]|nr:translational GTPase TypA [Pirellulales bacterium]
VVDAAEGPMPQTRYVLSKALEYRLRPLVVINKIDRPDARPQQALDEVFGLFIELGADDEQAEFPYIFTSAREGYATHAPDEPGRSMEPLFEMILAEIPGPQADVQAPLQMLVTTLDWSEYVGRIAIGRLHAGSLRAGEEVLAIKGEGRCLPGRAQAVFLFDKLGRIEVPKAEAGDIAAVVGLDNVEIGDTICHPLCPQALPRLEVEPPTLEMIFSVNTSPLAGRSGRYLTSRHLRDRLWRELERNVALRVRPLEGSDAFVVAGRGILHLGVLIETMRREGYELSVGKPRVITHQRHGIVEEPFETLVVEVPPERLGPVMELVGSRRGQLQTMQGRGSYQHLTFTIPARGLIGLRTRLLNATQGTAVMHHRFLGYRPQEGEIPGRANGVLVSTVRGRAVAFSLDGLQERAELFIAPGDEVYEGMIVGENSRAGDMNVNPTKEKKLTNIRAAGNDRNILLKPPRQLTLELALAYIEEDELVEVTPDAIRLRKAVLSEADRRRLARQRA